MRVFMIFMLICVGLCGCNTISISDSDATVYSIEAIEIDDMEDGKGDIAEADSEEESFYEPEEDIFPVISAMYGESRVAINELSQCDGIMYSENWEKGISLNATVDIPSVTELNIYEYELKECDESVRCEVLGSVFGENANQFVEDSQNAGYYIYRYGEGAGDYYRYQISYPQAGPTVYGETAFWLMNEKPNLYPFNDNIVTASDIGEREKSAIEQTQIVMGKISGYEDWKYQYHVPYGTQGRHPYNRIVYKLMRDNLYVNAYNDTYFLVDQKGIEMFTGTFFNLRQTAVIDNIIPVETAIDVVRENIGNTEVAEFNHVSINKISLEYIIIPGDEDSFMCFPMWRFYISYDEYSGRDNKNLLCGVNALTGEFIFEERGFWF